ncbi:protein MIS12 homolog [Syngnathus typhle]|uniref:protein MIS12 homolog n=1 Tax=Syngnathus typhle TaxID=161592 RepID=UPI002A6B3875|nr:protein MIS12 homolog [Syngnathus typhle]
MDVREDTCVETDMLPVSSLELYESQFFGFTPQTLMFRLSSAFIDSLCHILNVVEKVCVRQLSKGDSDATTEEQLRVQARECSRKLQAYMGEGFKQLSERMEEVLVTLCFSVPPNVLLKEDQCHRKHPPDTQEILRLETSLKALHRAHEAEVCARHALQVELEEQAEVQKQLDGFLARFRDGNGIFEEHFKPVATSMKKLQQVIVGVCNKTQDSH